MQVSATPKRVERTPMESEYVSLIKQTGDKAPQSSWDTWRVAKALSAALFLLLTGAAIAVASLRTHGGHSSGNGLVSGAMKSDTDDSLTYDEELAKRMLKLSYATFCDNATSIENWDCYWCKQVSNFTVKRVIEYSDIKVIIGYDHKVGRLVGAYSGGTALLNFLIWSWMPPIPYPGVVGGACSAGIADAYMDVHTELEEVMEETTNEYPGTDWYFTGYDWGGSFASYSALKFMDYWEEHDNDAVIELYSFGQTRWANKRLADYFDERIAAHWRVTNQRDFYVNMPLEIQGLHHSGTTVWYKCGEADDDGSFDYEVCDSELECAPVGASLADHEIYIGTQYGCSEEEQAKEYTLSPCGNYVVISK